MLKCMSDACAVIGQAPHVECCDEEHDTCWICLDGPKDDHPLVRPCSCPRTVHASCLAKWQLTSAGRNEETRCRFCNALLPDWRPALTPTELKPAASVMSVRYRGVTHKITYTPGPDGLAHFLETLRSIGIKVASASQVTFLCRSPDTGEEMALKGLKAFDAAAYCASITAAKRMLKEAKRKQPSPDGTCATDTGACSSGSEPASPTAAAGSGCGRPVAHVHAESFHVMDAEHAEHEEGLEQPPAHQAPAGDHASSSSSHDAAAPAAQPAAGPSSSSSSSRRRGSRTTAGDGATGQGSAAAATAAGPAAAPVARVHGARNWWHRLLSCVSQPSAMHGAAARRAH